MNRDLVEKILSLAKRGVYRDDIMLSGLGTRKELSDAINEAKAAGMYSVQAMRHFQKGTYYQYNP
jgi:hypothetical protein